MKEMKPSKNKVLIFLIPFLLYTIFYFMTKKGAQELYLEFVKTNPSLPISDHYYRTGIGYYEAAFLIKIEKDNDFDAILNDFEKSVDSFGIETKNNSNMAYVAPIKALPSGEKLNDIPIDIWVSNINSHPMDKTLYFWKDAGYAVLHYSWTR